MSDPGRPLLVIHVAAPPTRLAGRLKALMEARGWRLLRGDGDVPIDGFVLRVTAVGRAAGVLRPEPVEAAPAELARLLSQQLRARTVTYAESGPIIAYEACEGGRVVEKLVLRGAEVLEEVDSPHTARAVAGESLRALLAAAGVDGLGEPPPGARSLSLRWSPPAGVAGAEEIEIEAVITCPRCASPLTKRPGRYGEFWGCIKFPRCRGKRTLAEVERLRAGR